LLATEDTEHTEICSALRSAARPFSRSELLRKAIALTAKSFGLHFEAEQIEYPVLAETNWAGAVSVLCYLSSVFCSFGLEFRADIGKIRM